MQGEIENNTNIVYKIKEVFNNPSELKKYIKITNYSKPTDIKYRMKKNLEDNLPIYVLLAIFSSIIFCIRNLKCLFFASSWITYFIFLNSGETFKIKDFELTPNHILIATVCSNFFYLFLFQSVLIDILAFSLIISTLVISHSLFYEDNEMKDIDVPI